MLVLGLESTCDETGCAVVVDGCTILSNLINSQVELHAGYGGVVPELACRRHIDLFPPLLNLALKEASCTLKDIDLIAVSKGPGLIGALLVGLNFAKGLALGANIDFIGINHVEAHLYACLMSHPHADVFPAIGLVVSGGHTALLYIKEIGNYQLIGQTVDDAIGECFDKVATMLGLSYPGGPAIEKLAEHGDAKRFPLKAGRVKGRPWDFSFSGLKTSVLYLVKGQNADKLAPLKIHEEDKKNVAASFQEAALQDVVTKTVAAAKQFNCRSILVGGGVSNNQKLRQLFAYSSNDINILWPTKGLSLDNAAMIAGLGYHQFSKNKKSDSFDLEAVARIAF